MNANDKLIDNNWIYYISGSCFLIHVPKAANLHSPTRIRRHFWKRGYFSAFSKKYASQKCWNDVRKAASFTECALYDEWHHSIWKPQRGFRHCFPLPTGKKQFGVSKTTTLVTVSENLALRFLFPENAISFRPYVFLLFSGEIYAYRAPVDGAMDLLL